MPDPEHPAHIPAQHSRSRALWGQPPDRPRVFPEFTDHFIPKQTGFTMTCHKISSLRVATQKPGSTLWEHKPLAQRLEVLLGGFGGERGHLRDRSTVPISARVQAASGSLWLCPIPCHLLHTPQNKHHIPPTTNLGCRSWGQRPKRGRNARGTWWHFRVGVPAPGLYPLPVLSVSVTPVSPGRSQR